MSSGKADNVNVPSSLLSDRENRDVFDTLGKRCFVSFVLSLSIFIVNSAYKVAYGFSILELSFVSI